MRRILLAAALLACAAFLVNSTPRVEAGTALALDVTGLVDRSELVLEARVSATECGLDDRGRIETRYTLAVERTFLGEPRAVRQVRLPGGVLPDGRGLVLPGLPRLVQGEDVLLFLSRESSTGLRLPVGLAQGRFRVLRGEHGVKRLLRDNGDLELVDTAGRRLPDAPTTAMFDYAIVVQEIEAALVARREREAASPAHAPATPNQPGGSGGVRR